MPADEADEFPSAEDGVVARFVEYREGRDIHGRNRLIEDHLFLARQEAGRFRGRGEPIDDLLQVAQLGLLKAVERFDPSRGVPFTAFARPTIAGELRRHFRDATWSMRVPRRLKDLHVRLGRVAAELAAELHCSIDAVLEALDLASAYRPASLSAVTADDLPAIDPPADDGFSHLAGAADRVTIRQLLAHLPQRERTIVYLRFFSELSQSEIAERVGMSQVHVSRLLCAAMLHLKDRLEEQADTEPSPGTEKGLRDDADGV